MLLIIVLKSQRITDLNKIIVCIAIIVPVNFYKNDQIYFQKMAQVHKFIGHLCFFQQWHIFQGFKIKIIIPGNWFTKV